MKAKKIVGNCIKVALMLAVFVILFSRVWYVLRQKDLCTVQDNFRHYPKNTAEIVFIGQSHCFCSVDPNIVAEDYGIECFMLATSGQTVPESYYAAMEALEFQKPKAIVMEVAYCANDFRTLNDGMTHMFFDGMPECKAKKLAIDDLIEEEENRIYFKMNFGAYHQRWKELTEEDYRNYLTAPRGEFYSDDVFTNWDIPLEAEDASEPMPEEMERYMDLLVDLCKENNVELILFCAPFNSMYPDDGIMDLFYRQRVFHYISDYAKEKGVRYYNLFDELDELYAYGLNNETDWKDSQHLNRSGMTKFTNYMMEKGYFLP